MADVAATEISSASGGRRADRPAIPSDQWCRAPWNRWSFQHVSEFVLTTLVRRGQRPASALPYDLQPLDRIAFEHKGEALTVAGFLERSYTDGFIVLHRGAIVSERYKIGRAHV